MEISTSRTAICFRLLVILFKLNAVESTDKLFVADGGLGQIFIAETDGDSFLNSPLTPLNLSINDAPIGIDYDYRHDMIYWSDENTHTIHRSTVNGSFDDVIANETIVPHGIVLDLEEDKVFWVSASNGKLFRANLDGSNLEILDPVFTIPRGITISYNRRKLYITTRGFLPAIKSVNTNGSDERFLIDTDISSPSGITFDFAEQRLYWADDSLDKIESVNPDNRTDRITVLSVTPGAGLDLFPYGIALHHDDDVYFSDISHQLLVLVDFPSGVTDVLGLSFILPTEVHIYTDICADGCLNNGTCVRHFTSIECFCPFGFVGPKCEIDVCTNRCENGGACIPSERGSIGSICLCPEGFSGSKCELRSKYAPLIFVCDEEAGAILESSADSLDFSPLPIPNLYRPVAVAYSPEEDLIFWIDAENGTLNRAFRNGSDHTIIASNFSDFSDITIHSKYQILGYIASRTSLVIQQGYSSAPISIYDDGRALTSVCLRPSTDIYAFKNGIVPTILRMDGNSTVIETIEKPSLLSPSSMAFDRHGSRLFILDEMKQTLESCGPLGEDQGILLQYQITEPVDVEWYRGTALWTDDSSHYGIGFIANRGGPSTGITRLQQFQKAGGIYVYYGEAYERQAGEDCLEDEFACNDTICMPTSWRCDGLVDCEHGLDEADCFSDEPDSLVFVTDLDMGAIFMGKATNLSLIPLPLTGLQAPVAVDYDPVDGTVYWTDSFEGTISSALIDGTNQRTVVPGLGTPDGLYFDVQTKTIYWTDAFNNNIDAVYHNGTGRRNLLSNLDKPRAIIIVSTNRMLYWTEWGSSPKIELCDLTGQNRQVIIDSGLGWPNGITYDRDDSRLYWCDAYLDKIESSNIYGGDRKLLLDSSHGAIHPFDIVFHRGTIMWTDWSFDGIGVQEGSPYAWPKTYILPGGFSRPGGFHLYEDINECASDPCLNGGTCNDLFNMFTCTCVLGYTGPFCQIDINECSSYPCLNGGTCSDLINMYTCTCALGYNGTHCETDLIECASYPCLNGGTCNDLVNMYTCTCALGYYGTNCEIDINECSSYPCLNGGTCNDLINMYTCNCTLGYSGMNCETDLIECASYPCLNGGTCNDLVNMYTCTCALGYYGTNCEIDINECASYPCLNGGTCNDLINMYTCNCTLGYSGINCETDLIECASYPCLNGGTCNDLVNMYTCTCALGYYGTNCEIEIVTTVSTSTVATTTTQTSTTTHATTATTSSTTGVQENPSTFSTTPTGTSTEVTKRTEPIRVTSSPASLTVNTNEVVQMMCSFENAIRFEWQKDNVTIPGTENQNMYVISLMTPSHIGYYRCKGEGRNQKGATVAFTDQAALYIKDLSNIIIEEARFNINVTSPGDLSDSTSQYYLDAAEIIINYVQGSMIEAGHFEENSLFVVPSNLREGSIIANLNMYVRDNVTSSFQIQQAVKTSFIALSSRPDGILDASTVRVTSTSICPSFTWMSRFGEVVFVEGEINSWYNSTGRKCPFNTTNGNQPAATAQCVGDKISRPQWKPQDNCGVFRNVTELLQEIDKAEITKETVEEVTDHVDVITQNTEEITSSDVTLVSNIATEIAAQNISGREFTATVASIVSNVASVDVTELQAAEESNNAISNILMAYETQLNNVYVTEDEPFAVAEENVAVQVRSVPQDELNQGLVLSLSGDSSADLSGSNITVRAGEDTPFEEESVGLIAEVSIPPEIAAIALGASPGNANDTNINIIMSVFSTPVLFFSPSLLNFSRENSDVNRTANTPVILLSVDGVVIENLDQTINLTFTALEPGYNNQTCVFWDESNSEWSSQGCHLAKSESGTPVLPSVSASDSAGNGSDKETYTCACDHLTNFAILMDIHDKTTEYTYNILSYIGCAISIVCLLITLGTYLWNKKLRSRQTHQIFICLCATMLGLYISFVAMLALDTAREEIEVNAGACGFLAGLIHFFVLSSISWMGVEGFNTYLVIVRIFNTYIPHFMIKASLVAWGVPAIIVILTGGIANTNYAREDVCFLRVWSQIGGLLIPVGIVLIANVVVFILVIRQLSKSARVSGKVKKDKGGERKETIERIKNALTILVLLGLTWITGYLLLIEAFTLVFQALFILFNSFQGLFIFILYCLRKPVVRQQWGLTCSWCDKEGAYGGARRFSSSSASDTRTNISKFLINKSGRKYSLGGESISGVSTDGDSSGTILNPAYGDLNFGINTKTCKSLDESEI